MEGHAVLLAQGENVSLHTTLQHAVFALDDVNLASAGQIFFDVGDLYIGGADGTDFAGFF